MPHNKKAVFLSQGMSFLHVAGLAFVKVHLLCVGGDFRYFCFGSAC